MKIISMTDSDHNDPMPVDNNKQILKHLWIFQGPNLPKFNLRVPYNY